MHRHINKVKRNRKIQKKRTINSDGSENKTVESACFLRATFMSHSRTSLSEIANT